MAETMSQLRKRISNLENTIEIYKKNSDRYIWLTDGSNSKRDDYVWNHVLSEDDKSLGDYLNDVIDSAIERDFVK